MICAASRPCSAFSSSSPGNNPARRSVTSWGRYAESFAYDEATGVFSLDNPS